MRSGAAPAMWDHLAEELSSIQTTLDTSPTDIVNRPETAQPLASEVATPSTETEASPVELEEGEKPQAITDEKARSVAQMSEGIDIQPQLGEAYQESVTTPYGVRLPDETQRIDISQPADSVVPSETQPPSTSIDRQELDQMYAVQSEDPAVIQEQARLAIEAEREKELLDLRKNLSFDVKGGDNLENLIESRAADVYKGWTKAEYDTYSHLVAEQLRGMSGAELETLGIEGGNIDLIRPGEHINLTGIDPKILEDAYNQVADARVSPDAVPTSTESHQAPATPELNPDVPEVAPPTSYEQYSFANGENMQIPSEQFVELEKAATANMANDIRDYFTTSAWSPFSKDGELPYQKFVRDDVNGATKLLKTFSDGFVGVVEDPNMFNSDLNGEAFALENRPRLLHIYEGILQIARERGVDLDTFRKPGGLGKMSVVELLEKIEKEAVFSKLLESPRGLDAILAKAGADEILEKIVR
jgi:hypothetical protein